MKRLLTLLLIPLLTAGLASFVSPRSASAVTAADWRAGRIIDDGIFTNKDSMTVEQVQAFLNSKVGTGGYDSIPGQCDVNGVRNAAPYNSGISRAQYARSIGKPDKWTCLNNYYEVPKTEPGPGIPANNYGNPLVVPAGAKSAAQLIWDAAQAYNISPKVLLVTIHKESAGPLTTDDWPWQSQFTYAMGAHCPDSGPNGSANCDPNYAGFSLQIRESAALMRWYLDNMHQPWWSYKKPGNNSILYHPNTACGSSNVLIETKATAALYTYTPYQPNQAALNNLYGTGNSCSSYGNRNFWRIYNDWFGSTLSPTYAAQPVWQSIFTDNTKTVHKGWGATLLTGERAYAVVVMRNTSTTTWTNSGANETRLATFAPWGRPSQFCDPSWVIPCARPARLLEASVPPGSNGTFEFWITAPNNPGAYNEPFSLVVDGVSTFSAGSMNFQLNVEPQQFKAEHVWQSVFTDSTKATSKGWNANLVPGETAWAMVVMKNTSNFTWTKTGSNEVRFITNNSWGRQSQFCTNNWLLNCSRAARMNENSVPPGSTATFEFPLTAPAQPRLYSEEFGLIVDGKSTFNSGFMSFQLNVTPASYTGQPVWQQIFTNSSKTTSLGWGATLNRGSSAWAVVGIRNTGNVTWNKEATSPTRLATYPWSRQSAVCTGAWIVSTPSCTRAVIMTEATVPPGNIATFEFPITIPANYPLGQQNESFGAVVDGRSIVNGSWMNFQLNIQP